MNIKKYLPLIIAVTIGASLAYLLKQPDSREKEVAQIKIPTSFSALAKEGKEYFENDCAACHGQNGIGTENGPPLVHKIYEPGHHSDQSFYRAVSVGVRQHHWSFGNMPARPDVSQDEVTAIIKYVRELQRANGIF